MTTIALTSTHIAGDGLRCHGTERSQTNAKKIRVKGRDAIYALCGVAAVQDAVIAWYESAPPGKPPDPATAPTLPDKEDGWDLLVLSRTGSIHIYASTCPYPCEVTAPFTMGSGSVYAMGALHAGASAQRAVEIAAALDVHTGGDIQVVDIADVFARKTRMLPPARPGDKAKIVMETA